MSERTRLEIEGLEARLKEAKHRLYRAQDDRDEAERKALEASADMAAIAMRLSRLMQNQKEEN